MPGNGGSRRIPQADRLVYRIDDDTIDFLQCKYHYEGSIAKACLGREGKETIAGLNGMIPSKRPDRQFPRSLAGWIKKNRTMP
ncbi:MAG: hypothetical protein GVY10_07585 [Verrucomicrobia bacterium]|nr:hypothetical protein [Verrucomicrobiota bacterium]